MTMEKITSWLWRPPYRENQTEDSYWYENGDLVIVRDGEIAAESTNRRPAATAMTAYESIGYNKLWEHSKHTYDFLKAKGY